MSYNKPYLYFNKQDILQQCYCGGELCENHVEIYIHWPWIETCFLVVNCFVNKALLIINNKFPEYFQCSM